MRSLGVGWDPDDSLMSFSKAEFTPRPAHRMCPVNTQGDVGVWGSASGGPGVAPRGWEGGASLPSVEPSLLTP